jgi:hypothetical protein
VTRHTDTWRTTARSPTPGVRLATGHPLINRPCNSMQQKLPCGRPARPDSGPHRHAVATRNGGDRSRHVSHNVSRHVFARSRVVRGNWPAAARQAACGMHGWLLRTTGARGRGASPRRYAEVRAVAQEPRHGEADLRTATTRGMRWRKRRGNVRHCGAIAARWEGDEEGNQRAWAARQCGVHAVKVRRSGGAASSAPKGCCRSARTRRVVTTARAG